MFKVNEMECALLNAPLDRPPTHTPILSQQAGKAPLGRLASCKMTYMPKNCFPDIPQQLICPLKHEI